MFYLPVTMEPIMLTIERLAELTAVAAVAALILLLISVFIFLHTGYFVFGDTVLHMMGGYRF